MKALYRGFLIAMLLMIALGLALVIQGAVVHNRRPVTPIAPDGVARFLPAPEGDAPYV